MGLIAKTIGKKAPNKKFKYPAGHRVFKFTTNRDFPSINLLTSEQFQDANTAVLGLENTGTLYGEGKSLVFVNKLSFEYASRGWSVPGPDPRVQVGIISLQRFTNNTEILDTDDLQESPNCDPGSRLVSSVSIAKEIKNIDPAAEFAPRLSLRCTTYDDPTVETLCLRDVDVEAIIIVPENAVTGAKAPQINTSKLYELIDGDFELIDSFN